MSVYRPLKAETRVRIPLGPPVNFISLAAFLPGYAVFVIGWERRRIPSNHPLKWQRNGNGSGARPIEVIIESQSADVLSPGSIPHPPARREKEIPRRREKRITRRRMKTT